MISKGNHVNFARALCCLLPVKKQKHYFLFFLAQCVIKQLLDSVFVISRIIKVEVGVISRSRRRRRITLTETLIILSITKAEFNNCFIIHWTKKKSGSHVFASSPTAISTKCTKLTLPLEIMHLSHTWHDYPWPWVSLTWLLHNQPLDDVTGADFENSLCAFVRSEKRKWVQCILTCLMVFKH